MSEKRKGQGKGTERPCPGSKGHACFLGKLDWSADKAYVTVEERVMRSDVSSAL
jgi:hypothetical protein